MLVIQCKFKDVPLNQLIVKREKKDFQTSADTSTVGNDSFGGSIANQRKFILRNQCKM